jgi:DNA modification methylase
MSSLWVFKSSEQYSIRDRIVKFSPVIKIDANGKNRLGHTAPFPKEIPELAVKYYTYVGEKVLDPFAGSFTSAIVAKQLNRVGIGIEINKRMFREAIIERLKKEFRNDLNLVAELDYLSVSY